MQKISSRLWFNSAFSFFSNVSFSWRKECLRSCVVAAKTTQNPTIKLIILRNINIVMAPNGICNMQHTKYPAGVLQLNGYLLLGVFSLNHFHILFSHSQSYIVLTMLNTTVEMTHRDLLMKYTCSSKSTGLEM